MSIIKYTVPGIPPRIVQAKADAIEESRKRLLEKEQKMDEFRSEARQQFDELSKEANMTQEELRTKLQAMDVSKPELIKIIPKLVEAKLLSRMEGLSIISKARASSDPKIMEAAMVSHSTIVKPLLEMGHLEYTNILSRLASESKGIETPIKPKTKETGNAQAKEAVKRAAKDAARNARK